MKPRLTAVITAAALLSACAQTNWKMPEWRIPGSATRAPDNLKPPAGETAFLETSAKGVQIYECRQDKDGRLGWIFSAPEADLFDSMGNRVGRHFAGPTWELIDGSKVEGMVKERADAPAASVIPWLLLSARPVGTSGILGKTTSIQRVNTTGGIAPVDSCRPGARARVDYTATYYFFTTEPQRRWRWPL
jgi:hypothetical protein